MSNRSYSLAQEGIDPAEIRKQEDDALAQRVAEESGPVSTRKSTPIECVKLGLALDKAQQMTPDQLTKEIAAELIAKGVCPADIGRCYGISGNKLSNLLTVKWGLRKAKDVPEYPWATVTVTKREPMPKETRKQEDAQHCNAPVDDSLPCRSRDDLPGSGILCAPQDDPAENDIPETPISKAIHQAVEGGEVKIETVEKPVLFDPETGNQIRPETIPAPRLSDEKLAYLRDLENALAPPTFDLSTMRRFVPGNLGYHKARHTITFSANTIRLAAGLLATGPAEHQGKEKKFTASIRLDENSQTVVIQPDPEGYVFSSHKQSANKKAGAKQVADYLIKCGVLFPAVFEAEWDATVGAYVGMLVEKQEGVGA